jgi:hypothetical protein
MLHSKQKEYMNGPTPIDVIDVRKYVVDMTIQWNLSDWFLNKNVLLFIC